MFFFKLLPYILHNQDIRLMYKCKFYLETEGSVTVFMLLLYYICKLRLYFLMYSLLTIVVLNVNNFIMMGCFKSIQLLQYDEEFLNLIEDISIYMYLI